MNPILAAGLVTGGASLLGGFMGQSATTASTRRSIDFQREMSRNKYQYLMEDLGSAGLNPILAAQGASAGPAGASAPVIPYMNPLGEAVQTGVTTASTAQNIIKTTEEIKRVEALTKSLYQDLKGKTTRGYGWEKLGEIGRTFQRGYDSIIGQTETGQNIGRGIEALTDSAGEVGEDIKGLIKNMADKLTLENFQNWYIGKFYPERLEEFKKVYREGN